MKPVDLLELIALAAIWGASFLFMRLGAAEFGAPALTALRVAGGALVLLPLVMLRAQGGALVQHWRAITLVGLVNSALPYLMFSIAALGISAGLSSILNATAPLWAALVGWLWLKDALGVSRLTGVALGFAGVLLLAWDKASFKPGEQGVSAAIAVAACLLATLGYGIGANYAKRRLAGVSPLAVAAGSQAAAAAMLALPALWWAPRTLPGVTAWASLAGLAFVCTGIALLMYFRLIARVGAQRAITVTFLIPLFGVLWGTLFLGEAVTPSMALGGVVILVGTGLVTGVIALPRRAPTG